MNQEQIKERLEKLDEQWLAYKEDARCRQIDAHNRGDYLTYKHESQIVSILTRVRVELAEAIKDL